MKTIVKQKPSSQSRRRSFIRNILIFLLIFSGAVLICAFFSRADGIEGYASPVFVLAVLLISRFTDGYWYGLAASILGVVCVNYFFTYPFMAVNFYLSGYPLTFLSLLIVSLLTSTLTSQVKQRDELMLENEREKIRTDLLRSISHDIRTPLTSIIGSADVLLKAGDLDEEERQIMLSDIQNEAKWLLRMVENLLTVTKLYGEYNVPKQPWAIEEVAGEVEHKILHTYKDAPLTISIPETPLFVPMDPLLIEQVLINLIENSLIHGGSRLSFIHLTVTTDADTAIFTITDDGEGFPQELLDDIQTGKLPKQLYSDTDKKRNTGLGLRVCKSIIAAHDGTLRIQNRFCENSPVPSGAQVTFSLPL